MEKYILFDLDGTLTDSGQGIKNAIKYAMDEMNLGECSEEILNSFIGPPLIDSFKKHFDLDSEKALKAVETYRIYYKEKGKFENIPYDGIEKTLKTLKEKNNHLLLATSKPEVFAREILKHFNLDKYFDHIAGATLDGKISEKSDVIKYCLENYPHNIKETYMIGDRFYDIDGGKFWGLKTIGVTYGYGSRLELENAGADFIVDSPLEILNILS
ncbi:MAG: HAD hydrolase-like protein [Lagierella massiliensis]|nr:HAD hydrolase-like protein [Lagierella massiliensis]